MKKTVLLIILGIVIIMAVVLLFQLVGIVNTPTGLVKAIAFGIIVVMTLSIISILIGKMH